MKITDKNAVSHGQMALKADADACQLPTDARTQALLYRAAELLGAHDELVAALRGLLEQGEKVNAWSGPDTCKTPAVVAARAALTK